MFGEKKRLSFSPGSHIERKRSSFHSLEKAVNIVLCLSLQMENSVLIVSARCEGNVKTRFQEDVLTPRLMTVESTLTVNSNISASIHDALYFGSVAGV